MLKVNTTLKNYAEIKAKQEMIKMAENDIKDVRLIIKKMIHQFEVDDMNYIRRLRLLQVFRRTQGLTNGRWN